MAKASGSLTPPLADRLAHEMDSMEWLREKALEHWDDAEDSLEGPDRASALFLLRPEGWASAFAAMAWEASSDQVSRGRDRASREKGDLGEKLDQARSQVRALKKEVDELRRNLSRANRDAGAPVRRERAESEELRRRLADAEAELERERTAAAAAAQAARDELKRARAEVKRARAGRAEAVAAFEESRAAAQWMGTDPLALAGALDDAAAAATRTAEVAGPDGDGEEPITALPDGVRPDSAAAVKAVLSAPGPKHLIIDGYNLGLALVDAEPSEVRGRVEMVAARARAVARKPCRVSVVYDSALGGVGATAGAGLEIEFPPAGVSADDLIAEMATPASVVITDDRELRGRAEARGALTIWSAALVEWAARRS